VVSGVTSSISSIVTSGVGITCSCVTFIMLIGQIPFFGFTRQFPMNTPGIGSSAFTIPTRFELILA